ncbi:hypothetical protein [Desulfotignum balticum]|uniref:hypothetical protein n=1 Tax=Desulfotignum balticum TaxID=115781 RepID=UPI0004173111|nr:hypothetical protein [Desulfotignum balticum]
MEKPAKIIDADRLCFLGPARHVSHQKERPIQMVWQLRYPMPVEMFEENRRGG